MNCFYLFYLLNIKLTSTSLFGIIIRETSAQRVIEQLEFETLKLTDRKLRCSPLACHTCFAFFIVFFPTFF